MKKHQTTLNPPFISQTKNSTLFEKFNALKEQRVSMNHDELLEKAEGVRKNAYNKYSDNSVGAAVLAENGEIYIGCNVENINYTGTVHAEENALTNAISDGVEPNEFRAIAISVEDKSDVPPCGRCRQALSELCPPEMPVLVNLKDGNFSTYTVQQLLPHSMGEKLEEL